jgi:hypothetical protein
MSVMDVIKKYRQSSQSSMGAGSTASYDAAGGVMRRDLGAEAARNKLTENIRTGAAEEAVGAEVEATQQQISQMQRTAQITEQKQRGISDKQKYELKASEIIGELERSRKELSTREQLDRMEVAASKLRLADDKYRYQLEDTGRRQRLTDSVAFDAALKRATFADMESLFKYNINMKAALDLESAQFDRWLANLDLQTALQVADTKKAAAAESAMISGVSQAGYAGYEAYKSKKQEIKDDERDARLTGNLPKKG